MSLAKCAFVASVLVGAAAVQAATVTVDVVDFAFVPDPVITVGDTVHWVWRPALFSHSTTSVAGISESWDSGVHSPPFTYDHTFTNVGVFNYYCTLHGVDLGDGTAAGMAGTITVLPQPALIGSEPVADGTLPKTQNNVLLLTFDSAISLPGGPALSIINLHDSTNVSGSFTYTVQPDGVTLKAKENGAALVNQKWYRVTPGAGLGVQAFVLDVCTLQGDADGSGTVLAQDYFPVKNHLFEVTDARYDLDGSGQVLAQDYFVVKNHLFNAKPAKP